MFSVIIPTYNRAHLLAETMRMVLAQSFRSFELIVVDDGSTDHTPMVVKDFFHDARVRYIVKENGGVSAARNTGALTAGMPYLVFLDSDDEVTPNWLFDFSEAIEGDQPGFIQCAMKRVNSSGEKIEEPVIGSEAGPRRIRFNIPGSFAVRKDLFIKAGMYDEQLRFGENTELLFRIQPWNAPYALIAAPNFIYKPHPQGGAKNRRNRIAANKYVVQKHSDFFRSAPVLRQQYLQVAGVDAMLLGQNAEALKYLFKGWLSKPLHAKAFMRLLVGLLPPLARQIWQRRVLVS